LEGDGVELLAPEASLGAEVDDQRTVLLCRLASGGVVVHAPGHFLGGAGGQRQQGKGEREGAGSAKGKEGEPVHDKAAGSGAGLRARVRLAVIVLQPLGGYVGVDLGGGQTAVAEQLLHATDVGAGIEKVCGEAVP